jgi:hypothetical protein
MGYGMGMRHYRLTWPVFMVAVFVGCGRGELRTYRAGGTVSFPDGTPLAGGVVEFASTDPKHPVTARGEIQSDGTFALGTFTPGDGAIEGEHRAVVVPALPPGVHNKTPAMLRIIHPRFLGYETSGLRFNVSKDQDKNQFAIVVTRP